MAQSNEATLSWHRAYRAPPETTSAAVEAPPATRRHSDDLSRFIDDIIDGREPSLANERSTDSTENSTDTLGCVSFLMLMAVAIWGLVKISLL